MNAYFVRLQRAEEHRFLTCFNPIKIKKHPNKAHLCIMTIECGLIDVYQDNDYFTFYIHNGVRPGKSYIGIATESSDAILNELFLKTL